jgi:hypothetical protein
MGEGPVEYHVHGIVQIGFLGIVLEGDLFVIGK